LGKLVAEGRLLISSAFCLLMLLIFFGIRRHGEWEYFRPNYIEEEGLSKGESHQKVSTPDYMF
jgi:hypothetical protein